MLEKTSSFEVNEKGFRVRKENSEDVSCAFANRYRGRKVGNLWIADTSLQ
jgi:hypothetical protein